MPVLVPFQGAFTPDVNEALSGSDLHVKSMQRREMRELKNLNFGGYSRRVNQSGACSRSDVITSGGRNPTTIEDKIIVAVCGYPELYDRPKITC